MALTLGDVEPKKKATAKKTVKKKTAKKKVAKKKTTRTASKKVKTRPWQSPEIEFTDETSKKVVVEATQRAKTATESFDSCETVSTTQVETDPIKAREARRRELQEQLVKEWLLVAEELKNQGIKRLPEPVSSIVQDSWLGKIQLAPSVKIPIPDFFITKTRN